MRLFVVTQTGPKRALHPFSEVVDLSQPRAGSDKSENLDTRTLQAILEDRTSEIFIDYRADQIRRLTTGTYINRPLVKLRSFGTHHNPVQSLNF